MQKTINTLDVKFCCQLGVQPWPPTEPQRLCSDPEKTHPSRVCLNDVFYSPQLANMGHLIRHRFHSTRFSSNESHYGSDRISQLQSEMMSQAYRIRISLNILIFQFSTEQATKFSAPSGFTRPKSPKRPRTSLKQHSQVGQQQLVFTTDSCHTWLSVAVTNTVTKSKLGNGLFHFTDYKLPCAAEGTQGRNLKQKSKAKPQKKADY